MKKSVACLIAYLLVVLALSPARADGDEGLYDALPSPDSAFIRILNAGPGATGFEMTMAGDTIAIGAQSLSSYFVTKAGRIELATPGVTNAVTIEAGKYYTYSVNGESGKPALYEDATLKDPAKGRLYFYNLTGNDGVALYVPAAKTNALTDVKAASAKSVEVRAPLEVDMVARDGSSDIASFPGVKLKRRNGTSLVLSGAPGRYVAFSTANAIAK
jgi:Alginate O-acetyl transferase AlgF